MFKKISNETQIGILAAVSISLLILGYNYLKGNDIFSSNKTYYANYNQLEGLDISNPVKINGVPVGRVKEFNFIPGKLNLVTATFSIKGNVTIPKNSIAKITSSDILGSKEVDILLGDDPVFAKNGDTLKSNVEADLTASVQNEILPIKEKAETLLGTLDTVVTSINTVFNAQTRKNLTKSIASIQTTLNHLSTTTGTFDTLLKGNTTRLSQIFSNVESITGNLKDNNKQITNLIANLSSITDSVKKAHIVEVFNNAKTSLQNVSDVMEKINKGQGTMGLLVNDTKLYDNLNSSAKSLNDLLTDLKAHPKRYVHFSLFGGGKKDNTPASAK